MTNKLQPTVDNVLKLGIHVCKKSIDRFLILRALYEFQKTWTTLYVAPRLLTGCDTILKIDKTQFLAIEFSAQHDDDVGTHTKTLHKPRISYIRKEPLPALPTFVRTVEKRVLVSFPKLAKYILCPVASWHIDPKTRMVVWEYAYIDNTEFVKYVQK